MCGSCKASVSRSSLQKFDSLYKRIDSHCSWSLRHCCWRQMRNHPAQKGFFAVLTIDSGLQPLQVNEKSTTNQKQTCHKTKRKMCTEALTHPKKCLKHAHFFHCYSCKNSSVTWKELQSTRQLTKIWLESFSFSFRRMNSPSRSQPSTSRFRLVFFAVQLWRIYTLKQCMQNRFYNEVTWTTSTQTAFQQPRHVGVWTNGWRRSRRAKTDTSQWKKIQQARTWSSFAALLIHLSNKFAGRRIGRTCTMNRHNKSHWELKFCTTCVFDINSLKCNSCFRTFQWRRNTYCERKACGN